MTHTHSFTVDYTVMSWRELERLSRSDSAASAELSRRQRANAERKALWRNPEYQAQEVARGREQTAALNRFEEELFNDIVALNADYKSALDVMSMDRAYWWFCMTIGDARYTDMLCGRISLAGHEHVTLAHPDEIQGYLREVHPDFVEKFLDSRRKEPQKAMPPDTTLPRRAPVRDKRFKTW